MQTLSSSSILNKFISVIMLVLMVFSLLPDNLVLAAPGDLDTGGDITMGETNILGTTDTGRGNFLIAQQVVLPQPATIQSLSFYVSGAVGQLRLGIYTDVGNNPGTLITETAAFTPTAGWNTQNVLTSTLLPAGTYWLGHLAESNSLQTRYELTGSARGFSYTFGALPGTFSSSPQSVGIHYSFYATLSTGTVATNTPLSTDTPIPSTATFASTPIQTDTSTPASTVTNIPTAVATSTPTLSGVTMGDSNILGLTDSGRGNFLIAQQVVLSQTAVIQSLSFYVSSAAGQLRLGIYTDVGSNPGTLITETAAFTPTVGWNTQNVLTPTLLPAGTYWLAYLPQNNSLQTRYELTGTARGFSYTFGALPGSFSTSPQSVGLHYSFYATLSTSVVATNTPLPTNTLVPTTATFTSTFTPTNTATNTSVPPNTATNTSVPPTATFTSTFTPIFTATNTVTNTPNPPTATFTSVPAQTDTSTPVSTVTNIPTATATNTPTFTFTSTNAATFTPTDTATAPGCTDPATCNPVAGIPARWVCNLPGCTDVDWIGSVISWPSWSAYSSNARSGNQSRTVYSSGAGELLSPYMGSWANGCQVTVVSGIAVIIEWKRGTDTWRETLLNPGENHTISLISPEDGALIEGPTTGFSVSLINCNPQNIIPSPTPTLSGITMGDSNILGMTDTGRGNFLLAQQAVLSQTATIQSLSLYVTGAAGRLRFGIYTDAGSIPGTLITETAAFTSTVGWNTQNVLTPTLLPAGTYWLAYLPENSSLQTRYELTGTSRGFSYTFGALPGSFSTSPQSVGLHYSFYATLSTSTVATNTPLSTDTPIPSTATFIIPPTATQTVTAIPPTATQTSTAVPPTATQTVTAIPPTATQTVTAIPPTATQTSTAVPATATKTSTAVPATATQTSTAVPPTATKTSTAVPATATKTSTAVPATATKTSTAVPATATKTSTAVPATVTKTSTAVPATATKTSTAVPATATKTSTAVPATATKTSTAVPATATKTSTVVPATATKTSTVVPATATKTSTAVPATVTKTATKTVTAVPATATKTPTAVSNGLVKIQYFPGTTLATSQSIAPKLILFNIGNVSIPLSEISIRYWYTEEGTQPQNYWCDYAAVNCNNVSARFIKLQTAKTGASHYLELSFTSGAGSVAPGANTGEIQNRFSKNDWSNYTQTEDYSFKNTTQFIDWNHVTVYRNGTLIWGIEP